MFHGECFHKNLLLLCGSVISLQIGWNSQPTREVILEDCAVSKDNMIGEEGQVNGSNELD